MGGIAVNGSCGSEGTGRVASLFPPGNGVDEWEGGIIDFVGAWGRNRTGTVETYRGILRPRDLKLRKRINPTIFSVYNDMTFMR